MKYRLSIDIGGTFTDFALLDEDSGSMSIQKRLTSPEDPSVSVLLGTKELLERCQVGIDQIDTIEAEA